MAEVGVTTETPASGWESLSKIQPLRHDNPPQLLRFPDGSEIAIGKWVDLHLGVVKWLSDNEILTPEQCPIRYASRYLVNVVPQHPGGKPFSTQGKQIGAFHVEAKYGGPELHRNTVIILEHLSQDPDHFSVYF